MKLPIPVNIITGALGVGKTTALAHLLANCKPPGERWAVLVNEFGALGIDAALLEASTSEGAAEEHDDGTPAAPRAHTPGEPSQGRSAPPTSSAAANGTADTTTATTSTSSSTPSSSSAAASAAASSAGLVVRELAGGCLCCTLSGPLGVSIAQLVRSAKPDRLLIEPSGLGHPAGLLDTLHNEHLRSALAVRAVLCLVDVRAGAEELQAAAGTGPLSASETYQDQINVCDVLVGSKADAASPEQLQAFEAWARQLYPPKAQVVLSSRGRLDAALLDLPRAPVFRPVFLLAHSSARRSAQHRLRDGRAAANGDAGAAGSDGAGTEEDAGASGTGAGPLPEPRPRQPVRVPSTAPDAGAAGSSGRQQAACGWLFSADDMFDRGRLTALLQALRPQVDRLKGIFRVSKSTYVVPHLDDAGGVRLQPVSYRRESRFEVIVRLGLGPDGGQHSVEDDLAAAVRACNWPALETALLQALQ